MSAYAAGFPELMLSQLRDPAEALRIIRQWIAQHEAEDLYLDFKQKTNPNSGVPSQADVANYSKALSGFANSEGGLLVWGVVATEVKGDSESADVAREARPVTPLRTFHAKLNDITYHCTKPTVVGVQNLLVPVGPDKDTGFVVTYVPAGANPPYRSEKTCNNHYYRRSGSTFQPMEPYEIRDIVFRFRYPKIDLDFGRDAKREETDLVQYRYALRLDITNHGPAILKDYMVEITLPRVCSHDVHDWRREIVVYEGAHFERFRLFTAGLDPEYFAIYPGDTKRILGADQRFGLQYVVVPDDWRIPREGLSVRLRLLADRPPETRDMPFADEQAIAASQPLWSEVQPVGEASPPEAPGIYELFLVRPEGLASTPLAGVPDGSLLYVGAAPSLAGPDFQRHFTDNASGLSDFRHSIGAVLHDSLGLKAHRSIARSAYCFDEKGERRLTEWMVGNLGVSWRLCPSEADAASKVRGIVKRLQPVVDTIPGLQGRYHDLIESLRSRCREEADRG